MLLAAGGHVTGIIPEFLVSKERMLDGVQELIVTRTMHERKMAMFEHSSGFVALPGGIGTLEELAEILTWSQLKQHARPHNPVQCGRFLGRSAKACSAI